MRRLRVVGVIVTAALAAISTAATAASGSTRATAGGGATEATHRDFDAASFPAQPVIDNQWLPMLPGTQLVFQGESNRGQGRRPHRVVFTVTDLTKVIDGVRSVVIWDQDINHGELLESEIAFNAQDNDGNVWLLGEYPGEFQNGEFKRAPDTWISGVDGAQGGVLMRGDPQPGTSAYLQGDAPEIEFKDKAKVARIGGKRCVPADCFDESLVIREWNPLEPEEGFQLKYYGRDVGNIQVGARGGKEKEILVLTKVRQLDAEELAEARAAALELEAHAYEGSEVYGTTAPLEVCTPDGQCTPAG